MKTKVCTKCKIEKDIDNFSKSNKKDGLSYWCKECFKIYTKNNYLKNKKGY